MKRDLLVLAAAGSLLITIATGESAFAQKPTDALRVHALDAAPSMSIHEEMDARRGR